MHYLLVICAILVCVPLEFSLASNIACPTDWVKYNMSCYKNYPAAQYIDALNSCVKVLTKQQLRRPYLVNIESEEEMNFVRILMVKKNISEMYIGATNIAKRSNVLSWERLGLTSDVDKRLLCPDIYVDSSNFYCGYLKNRYQGSELIQKQLTLSSDTASYNFSLFNYDKTFCVNVSDCSIAMPFLCEVNCTNQERQCEAWSIESKVNKTAVRVVNPCETGQHKCQNNATCLFNPKFNGVYTCLCQPGYEGVNCQLDERPCRPHKNRCVNNSTCNQFDGLRYNCTCPSGFTGFHCEINIDDCVDNKCQNGAQCEDLINDYRCICLTFFEGQYCEIKQAELVMKENVSRSFSVFAICFIIFTFGFFITLDALRFVFKIEPEGLTEERQLIRKKKLMKKIIKDMKDNRKRKKYRKIIHTRCKIFDPFIQKLEKTFKLNYDRDLRYIDEDSNIVQIIQNKYYSSGNSSRGGSQQKEQKENKL